MLESQERPEHLEVTVHHVCSVSNELTTANKDAIDSLPLQQKIALICLTKEPTWTLGKLYDAYFCYLKKSETEFMCMISMLEASGFISLKKNKQAPRLSKVWLKLDKKQIEQTNIKL